MLPWRVPLKTIPRYVYSSQLFLREPDNGEEKKKSMALITKRGLGAFNCFKEARFHPSGCTLRQRSWQLRRTYAQPTAGPQREKQSNRRKLEPNVSGTSSRLCQKSKSKRFKPTFGRATSNSQGDRELMRHQCQTDKHPKIRKSTDGGLVRTITPYK